MPGTTPRFLRINLSTGEIKTESVDEQVTMDFIGGRGYGISYLYRELSPDVEPFSEHNKLILVNGVLAGTSAQAVSRWMVYTKSPLTGALARSVAGADFGAWMKFAGYDFIIIEGKAEKPVYIHLTGESCQIHDAGEIWGKNTEVAQDWLTKQYGNNTRTACIGPGGEKLVRYAAIVSQRRTAGRCGTGAVMGSKNLKAIAITTKRNLQLHDPEGFKELTKKQVEIMLASKGFQHHKEMGTTTTQDVTNDLGIFPVRNFQYGRLDGYEKIVGAEYQKLRTGAFGCYSCAAKCGMIHRVPDGPYAGALSEGPEYETIWAFNGPIESNYIQATIAADQICDDLGIDTISTGSTIGFAYELYEKGLLTKKETDGLELVYGNHSAMVDLVRKIGLREGIGDLLAEGTMRAAAKIGKGAEEYAIHVKGLELPAYEPRGAKSQGFNYVTSNIGGSHTYGYAAQEIFGAPVPRQVDRFAEEENADIVIFNQNATAMTEVGVVCVFTSSWGWIPSPFGEMLAAVTGREQFADLNYLREVGDRIINLERAFIVREGFSRKDDTLPKRLTNEPLHTRGAEGEGQVVRELDKFLDKYYQLRGWTKDGVPSEKKLNELGLGDIAKDMKSHSSG
ncbi:aldehyde ferredoxin oxidoreductase family protein [Thermodesulfobacteriota bacterium]